MLKSLEDAGALMLPEETEVLMRYASFVPRDEEIVELGSWAGGSAAWLCAGSQGAHITCVDIWEDWIDPPPDQEPWRGVDALARFSDIVDWSKVTALKASSLDVAPMWVKPIGLLFIDALHTYEGCRDDYLAWAPHIVKGGILTIHDVGSPDWWSEGPTAAVADVVVPSGLWEHLGTVGSLWTARRL